MVGTAIRSSCCSFGLWIGWLIILALNSTDRKGFYGRRRCTGPRTAFKRFDGDFERPCSLRSCSTPVRWLRVIGAFWIVAVALNLAPGVSFGAFHDEAWPDYRWLRSGIPCRPSPLLIAPIWTIIFAHVDWMIALAPLFISHLLILYPTLVPHSQWWGPVVRSFQTSGKEVWITIDDGPTPSTRKRSWICSIVTKRAPPSL